MITQLSGYAGIVGSLATEHGLTIRETLNKISKPWDSDLQDFFLEECANAQIDVPTMANGWVAPELLRALYKLADKTGE